MTEKDFKGIKGWKEDDRPREKCLAKGISSLSDAELLAVLLGSGTRSKTAVELGRELLKNADNSLAMLGRLGIDELSAVSGVGKAKAITLMSAFEIGRRRSTEDALDGVRITSSRQAAEVFLSMLSDLKYEECWVMLLNNSNKVIGRVQISSGGVTQTLVDPKLIFKAVLQHTATGFVLCHNHPGGCVEPSDCDLKMTRQVLQASKAMDVRMVDHIIVGNNTYYSFSDNHLL